MRRRKRRLVAASAETAERRGMTPGPFQRAKAARVALSQADSADTYEVMSSKMTDG